MSWWIGIFLPLFLSVQTFAAIPPLEEGELVKQAIAYHFVPVLKKGSPVLDENTGAPLRVRRTGYIHETCVDLKPTDFGQWNLENWMGFDLESCSYHVKDKKDGKESTKNASVILLKTPPELLGLWMAQTCLEIGAPNMDCVKTLTNHMLQQSGGHFVIRGIVYEDQYIKGALPELDHPGEDGEYEPYCFRDGVTFYTGVFDRDSTDPLTIEQSRSCFETHETEKIQKNGRFSQGLTPETYVKMTGDDPTLFTLDEKGSTVPTMKWLTISRDEMQKAVRTGRNRMLTFWAKKNLNKFVLQK